MARGPATMCLYCHCVCVWNLWTLGCVWRPGAKHYQRTVLLTIMTSSYCPLSLSAWETYVNIAKAGEVYKIYKSEIKP
jgi:hypothetical protein